MYYLIRLSLFFFVSISKINMQNTLYFKCLEIHGMQYVYLQLY